MMGITSLQVCMDSSEWLQEAESSGYMMDSTSSSPSAAEMLASCTRPPAAAAIAAAALMDSGRRLRPPQDHPLKCPRCESTHTKFCYYNNYSLSQPRYFCKTCRRYWTKGGTLRNIPVGGGCRKNKKPSSTAPKKSSNSNSSSTDPVVPPPRQNCEIGSSGLSSFSRGIGLSQFTSVMGATVAIPDHNNGFLESKHGGNYISLFPQNPRPIDFLDSKFDLMGVNNNLGMVSPEINGDQTCMNHVLGLSNGNFHGSYSACGAGFMDTSTCQGLMLSYDHHSGNEDQSMTLDVKPNPKPVSLNWQQDQGCPDTEKDGAAAYGGYISGLGPSWNGFLNGYGSSTRTNSFV